MMHGVLYYKGAFFMVKITFAKLGTHALPLPGRLQELSNKYSSMRKHATAGV
jgi:hypothetical protein